MLVELEVRDFAIIERLRLRLGPGFNVLTGETGAGKSIIVGAVGQLLGERASTELIRTGAARARVEGVFEPGRAADAIRDCLEAYGIDEDPVLIMAREIHAEGRSTARVNGRMVPVRALTEIGRLLIDIHGQSETAALRSEAEHGLLLDRYAGLEARRADFATRARRIRALRSELEALVTDERDTERRAELLRFQVDEIEAARLRPDEEAELLSERRKLVAGERLVTAADRARRALQGAEGAGDGGAGAADLLDAAIAAVSEAAEAAAELDALRARLAEAHEAVIEAARELRAFREGFHYSENRLEEVEERLQAYADLKRKFGPEVEDVLAYGRRAAAEFAAIEGSDERAAALQAELAAVGADAARIAVQLSDARKAAGLRLAGAVVEQLAELGMPDSAFEVELARRPDPEGLAVDGRSLAFDEAGIERVAFLVSTNAGEPPRALSRTASGGEMARIMLALKGVLSQADSLPTLVFDEIDAGIGGRLGAVVGRKLWALSATHQVLSVTHLPQVAVYGDLHYHVHKAVEAGRSTTLIERLDDEQRLDELAQMLGGGGDAALENARQMMREAGEWKAAAAAAAPAPAPAPRPPSKGRRGARATGTP